MLIANVNRVLCRELLVSWLVGWLVGINFTSGDEDQVHHLASRRAYTKC